MDITGKPLKDCCDFSVPFILISVVFFSLYLFLGAMILSNSGIVYFFNRTYFFAVILIVSCVGSTLLVWRMKKRSLYWLAGLPLCIITGIIPIFYVMFSFHDPLNPALRYLANALIAEIIGYAVLPACAVYFLKYWKKTSGRLSDADILLSSVVAIAGLVFFIGLLFYAITYVPLPVSPYHDNFLNFTMTELLLSLFGLFYGGFLLPAVGVLFLAHGLEYRKASSNTDNNPVTP